MLVEVRATKVHKAALEGNGVRIPDVLKVLARGLERLPILELAEHQTAELVWAHVEIGRRKLHTRCRKEPKNRA